MLHFLTERAWHAIIILEFSAWMLTYVMTYDLFALFTIGNSLEKSNEDKQSCPEQGYIGGIA